ncbi:MAG: DUF3098 domain-containing protein [Chitinophagales bacterium]
MSKKKTTIEEPELLFTKKNYALVVLGFAIMIIGYFLMIGGGNPEPHIFNAEEKYSFVRTTLSPIFILGGLFIVGMAIFTKR